VLAYDLEIRIASSLNRAFAAWKARLAAFGIPPNVKQFLRRGGFLLFKARRNFIYIRGPEGLLIGLAQELR
jgi:hypothetical protein